MLKSKQIERILTASVRVNNFTANGASNVVTTALSTALGTAGNAGVAVPVQVSANVNSIGVITAAAINNVEIYGNASKQRIETAGGDEIYGRLTESGGVYTLTYFTITDAGTETAHTFGAATAIDFKFFYRFDFSRYPADAIQTTSVSIVDPVTNLSTAANWFGEKLTVVNTSGVLTVTLTKTPTTATEVYLLVNGQKIDAFGGASARISVSGKVVTWSTTNAGYAIDTTDNIVAWYKTAE